MDGLFLGAIFGILATLIQGAWPVASRFGVQQTLDAYDLAALRFGVAGFLLLPIVIKYGLRDVGLFRALVLTATGGAPYVIVAISGLSFAPPGHHGVIGPSSTLIISVIGGWLLLSERLNKLRFTGLVIIVSGVILIGWKSFSLSEGNIWYGDVLFVCGAFLWASYTVCIRYWSISSVQATAIVSVLSMGIYLPIYIAMGKSNILSAPASEIVFQGLFQGFMVSILAFFLYTRSIAILGASRGVVFQAMQPAIVIVLAAIFLYEYPTNSELIGLLLVSTGMVFALGIWRWRGS